MGVRGQWATSNFVKSKLMKSVETETNSPVLLQVNCQYDTGILAKGKLTCHHFGEALVN